MPKQRVEIVQYSSLTRPRAGVLYVCCVYMIIEMFFHGQGYYILD